MRGLFAVARREVLERRWVFAAAIALGFLPFLIPLHPAAAAYGSSEARLFAAAFCAIAFSGALSLLLGGSTIGSDLSQRRLAFYFARPLSGAAIWGGKFVGIWLMVMASALLILFPVGLADFSFWWKAAGAGSRAGEVALLFAGAVVLCLALGNLVSLSLRARSAWALADLILSALFALGLWAIFAPLLDANAPTLAAWVAAGLGTGIAAALLLAGLAQVAVGRTDVARGTRARFAALWSLLLLLAVGCLGSVRWLLSPDPADLTSLWVNGAAASGNAIVLGGTPRGRADLRVSFFYDVSSGRFLRASFEREGAEVLSEDGTTAAWTRHSLLDPQGSSQVWFCRLAERPPRPRRLPIAIRFGNVGLSPEGSKLAVASDDRVSVFDLASGRLLAAVEARSDEDRAIRFAFRNSSHLLLYRIGPLGAPVPAPESASASIVVQDLDISARRIARTAVIEGLRRPFSLAFDDRHGRILVWEKGAAVSLFDSNSGARLASLGDPNWDSGSRAFLSDGRPVLAEATGGTGRLHLFDAGGHPERVFDLGRAGFVRIGAEPEPGKLTLAISPTREGVWTAGDAFLLDLRSATLRKIANHAYPIATNFRWRTPFLEPASAATRIFARHDGALLWWEPSTQSVKALRPGH